MADLKIDKSRYSVDSLYQWDTNQELKIYGLSMLDPEIHFTNEAMGGSIVVDCTVDESGVISVNIPNSFLTYKYSITVYVSGFEGDTFKTYHKFTIPVKARKRPGDYTLTLSDNEVYSFRTMNDRITNIEDEIKSEGSILYSYTLDADGVKLVEASGKKTIGEYIPLVSSSLKAVKGLSDKFKTMIDANRELGETALSIAKGRNQARVFDTTADMETWLKDESNKGVCNIGDNLYIVALEVPDWWVCDILDTPDASTGYYYKIAKLEVQKVDLTTIESDIDTLQSGVNTLNTNLNAINTNLTNKTNTLQSGLDTANGEIDVLQSDVNTLEGEVDVIQGKIANLEGVDLIASAVEVDDTNLGLGKNNVQDVLESLNTNKANSSDLEWKLLGSATGTTKITLPTTYNELYIVVDVNNSNGVEQACSTTNLIKKYIDTMTSNYKSFYMPTYDANPSYATYTRIRVIKSDNAIQLFEANYIGSNYINYSKIVVYYR